MARIPIWHEDDSGNPAEIKDALEYSRENFGENLNIFREMANNPNVLKGFVDLTMTYYGEGSSISPAERELAYTTATVVNNCHY